MKKLKLLIILSAFMIFIPTGYADTKEDMQNILDEMFKEDIKINAIDPSKIGDETASLLLSTVLVNEKIMTNEFNAKLECEDLLCKYVPDIDISDDYKTVTVSLESGGVILPGEEAPKVSKTLNLIWEEYDETKMNLAKDANQIVSNNNYRMTDLEFIKYFNSDIENYLVSYIKGLVNNDRLSYKLVGSNLLCSDPGFHKYGVGFSEYRELDNVYEDYLDGYCGEIAVMVDNVYYNLISPLNLKQYRVLYIPEDTNEDENSYLKAAQDKISKEYPNIKLSKFTPEEDIYDALLLYKRSELDFGYENNLISKKLNANYQPIYVEMTGNNQSSLLIIAKGNDEVIANSKEEITNSSQKEPENPNTGAFLDVALLIISLGIVGFALYYLKKHKKFYNI